MLRDGFAGSDMLQHLMTRQKRFEFYEPSNQSGYWTETGLRIGGNDVNFAQITRTIKTGLVEQKKIIYRPQRRDVHVK